MATAAWLQSGEKIDVETFVCLKFTDKAV